MLLNCGKRFKYKMSFGAVLDGKDTYLLFSQTKLASLTKWYALRLIPTICSTYQQKIGSQQWQEIDNCRSDGNKRVEAKRATQKWYYLKSFLFTFYMLNTVDVFLMLNDYFKMIIKLQKISQNPALKAFKNIQGL